MMPRFYKWFIIVVLSAPCCYGQKTDTLFVLFDERFPEMNKVDFTHLRQMSCQNENLKKSISFKIDQMEKEDGYLNQYDFSHFSISKKESELFDVVSPSVLKMPKSFLDGKSILDIKFFRTTPNSMAYDLFEWNSERQHQQIIFLIDVNEEKNDSIVLREVRFSGPLIE